MTAAEVLLYTCYVKSVWKPKVCLWFMFVNNKGPLFVFSSKFCNSKIWITHEFQIYCYRPTWPYKSITECTFNIMWLWNAIKHLRCPLVLEIQILAVPLYHSSVFFPQASKWKSVDVHLDLVCKALRFSQCAVCWMFIYKHSEVYT